MTAIEKRAAQEVRAEGRKLVGYAATFNHEARIADFSETVKPGAFRATIADGHDILALVDHDRSRVLARTKSGTLRLSEDERGLRFELDVPDTTAGRDVLAMAARGDLGGCSFGFTVPDGGDHWTGDKRELRAVHLAEVSVINAWPAYEGTSVQARAKQQRSAADRRIALLDMEARNVAV